MKSHGRKLTRAVPIFAIAVVALLGSAFFAQGAYAKGAYPPNTSGDTRAVFHTGNIQPYNIGNAAGACPGGEITIPGATANGTYITIPPQPAGSSFVVYVKGGPQYNTYSYPPLDPTNAASLTSLHAPVNNGGNIAGISHWFICGTVAPPPAKLPVYFGYADAGPTGHTAPSSPLLTFMGGIWQGAAAGDHVNFVGNSAGCSLPVCGFDAGAIRIDNPTASDVSVSAVTVTIGANTYQPWGVGTFTIPANGHLVLTQSNDWNFDTSDDSNNGTCSAVAVVPVLHITTGAGAQTVNDTSQTLITHGKDQLECDHVALNESLPWAASGNITL